VARRTGRVVWRLAEYKRGLEPKGLLVMNIHKSKGKEFDGVILVEEAFKSFFFDDRNEKAPFPQSRRLLRVAITRARVAIVRPMNSAPLCDS
jgi:DNA helicase-2/ATP-dependent DNA helicase PcrA